MDGIKITMVGLRSRIEEVDELQRRVTGKQLMPAVISGTLLILNRAKELAPYLAGHLKRSLHIGGYSRLSPGFDTSQGYSDIGGKVETVNEAKVEMGTNIIYGPIQEFGGIIRAKNKPYLVFRTKDGAWHSVKSVQIPAHPYIRPSFDEKQDACVKEISDALDVMIAKAGLG